LAHARSTTGRLLAPESEWESKETPFTRRQLEIYNHQDVDRTLRGRVNQNDRGQGQMEKVRPWCGQPTDRGQLKNRTEH